MDGPPPPERGSGRARGVADLIAWAFGSRPLRFLVVGGFNTLFGYGLFAALYLMSHARQPSLVLATMLGVLFNYVTTGRLVFANRGLRALPPFVAGYGVVLLVNMGLLEGLTRLGLAALVAQAVSLPFVVALSYLVNRYVVFAARRPGAPAA